MAYLEIDDEPAKPLPTPEEALAEVADWKRRVDVLYRDVIDWLPKDAGYEVDLSRSIPVHESMLKILGLPGYQIPILQIMRNGKRVLLFHPDARWVLFTRGRVNIMVGDVRFGDRILAKEADADGPEWRYRTAANWQREGDPWNRERLIALLGEVP